MDDPRKHVESEATSTFPQKLMHELEHKHSGHEVLMSGGANACPICQAFELTSLRQQLVEKEKHTEADFKRIQELERDNAALSAKCERLKETVAYISTHTEHRENEDGTCNICLRAGEVCDEPELQAIDAAIAKEGK